jgi:hypothetical protein
MLFVFFLVAACTSQLGGVPRAQADGTPPFTDTRVGLTGVSGGTVAWGDYNSDGKLDILFTGCATWDSSTSSCTRAIAKVYRNNGDGTFTDIGASLTGVFWGAVAWGDYNNDGKLDILLEGCATWNQSTFTCTTIAKVYRNNGDGTFSDIGAGLTGAAFGTVAWGDYDNDGRLDILSTTDSGSFAKVYRNNGDGTFSENTGAQLGSVGVWGASAAWGDYDSDGRLDILLEGCFASDTNGCSSAIAKVYRNNGDGTFSEVTSANLTGVSDGSVAWGDYNSDGKLDILLTGIPPFPNNVSVSKVYRNNGDGTFSEDASADLTGVAGSAAWGDYNSDGRPDILLAGSFYSSSTVTEVYRNNGGGTFSEVTNANLSSIPGDSAAWGDYNNDSRLDILVTNSSSNSTTKIYRNETATPDSAPSAPIGLASSVSGSRVTLSWDAASDTTTPAAALTYNLRVGTTPGGSQIASPMALSSGLGLLPQMGNVQEGTDAILENLPNGTYYWSVQAIDSSFAGSPFATEETFIRATPCTFSFSSADYSATEDEETATITINRTGSVSGSDSVHFATANGTATAGSDYTTVNMTVTFAAGETSKTVSVPITDDSSVEVDETVQLSLSSPSSRATLGSPHAATLTITDNDTAPPPDGNNPPTKKSSGKIISAKLSKKSFPSSQAAKVKLSCKFSPKSKIFRYVLSLKKGKKWAIVKRVSKTGSFKKYTLTVKKLFAGKSIKRGQYRLKLSADKNSKALRFKVT